VLFLAACGSSGMGDILGGGGGTNTGNNSRYEIRGTVDSVDSRNQSIYLTNVSGYTSMLSNGGSGSSGNSVQVYFDNQTTVDYQGRAYRPEDLERGDQVTVRVDESGNRLVADAVQVTYNAGGGSMTSSYPGGNNGSYGSVLRGTVRNIDTSRGTIELDRGTGSVMMVDFDRETPVYFNSSTYRVADLDRGDEVEIRYRDLGNGRMLAQDITVTRNMNGNSSGVYNGGTSYPSQSSQYSTMRGTVVNVDTSRRTIDLEYPSWINGFNTGAGSNIGNRVTVYYGTSTQVNVSGQWHPVNGLERGDVVEVRVTNDRGTYMADSIYLVRDVNAR
jgi:hypothetical protein